MTRADTQDTVVVSRGQEPPPLAERLHALSEPVAWFGSVEDLLRTRRLSSIRVLVVYCRLLPLGTLFTALGRMSLEYPGIQKVAVVEAPLPLPIARYLAALGAELVWAEPPDGSVDRIASVVHRMHERSGWLAALAPPSLVSS